MTFFANQYQIRKPGPKIGPLSKKLITSPTVIAAIEEITRFVNEEVLTANHLPQDIGATVKVADEGAGAVAWVVYSDAETDVNGKRLAVTTSQVN